MVQHGIALGHEISSKRIEVNKTKIEVIAKLLMPKCVKDILSYLGHARFYCKFIKDFSKIARPLTNFFAKDVPFIFDDGCLTVWEKLKMELSLHQSFLLQIGPNHLRSCAMLPILP